MSRPRKPSPADAGTRGPGRPPLSADERRRHRVYAWLTDNELEQLDVLRGETDRATWLRERGLGRGRL